MKGCIQELGLNNVKIVAQALKKLKYVIEHLMTQRYGREQLILLELDVIKVELQLVRLSNARKETQIAQLGQLIASNNTSNSTNRWSSKIRN